MNVTWNSKILKNKSKNRDSNFLVVFSSSKALRAIERAVHHEANNYTNYEDKQIALIMSIEAEGENVWLISERYLWLSARLQ